MNKILVTGATGFVGKFFLQAMLSNDYWVQVGVRNADNLSFGDSSALNVFQIGEINATTDWTPSLARVNVVIHLAARAHVLKHSSTSLEQEFNRVNIDGTVNLVKQSIAARVKHFIFISSVGAMGTLSDRTFTEQTSCYPDTLYGCSKLRAEEALISLASQSSMTWTILRPTLIYGPGNPGNMERLLKLVNGILPTP